MEYKIATHNSIDWHKVLNTFEDSSLYQTEAFTKRSIGGKNPEYFLLFDGSEIVAAAIIRIKTIPLLSRGVAYIRWGPMWKRKGAVENLNILDQAIDKLVEEYVIKRKLGLSIMPNIYDVSDEKPKQIFLDNKFIESEISTKYHTLLLDLSPSLEEIKKNFINDWRRRLNKGFEAELEVIEGTEDELYKIFIKMYKQTHSRKKFKEYVNVDSFRELQNDLNASNKMRILVCMHEKEPIAAFVITGFGDTGIALLGGSTKKGLKMSASVMLHWKTIRWLKKSGAKYYDLGGIDPINNKSVYKFKKGSRAKEVFTIGPYDRCDNLISKIIINGGSIIKNFIK